MDNIIGSTDLEKYSFLITGGAGFIGSNIVEHLLKLGAKKVRVLDNYSTGKKENLTEFERYPNLEIIEGDIRDFKTCIKAMEDIDFVSHQAALGSVPRSIVDPITTNEVNISGFLNILVAARDQNVKKMVYAASSSTYGDSKVLPKREDIIGKPLSPYAITKYVNELYAEKFSSLYGFSSVGLRYFNIFGPRQSPDGAYAAVIPLFMKAAITNEVPFINGDGTQTRDFTFVSNAVQANVKAMLSEFRGHEVLNIACGKRISLNDLWNIISNLAGTEIKPQYRDFRVGDVMDSLADISKAHRLITYQPEHFPEEGLKLTFDWYKKNG